MQIHKNMNEQCGEESLTTTSALILKIGLTVSFIILCLMPAIAQKTVSGLVTDSSDNKSLENVSVIVEGIEGGTVTDSKGAYSITVPSSSAALIFSFVGYNTQKIVVGNSTQLNVSLVNSDNKLNDVVVIGYGTRPKGAITGAISSVKAEVFEDRPRVNVYDALQGRLPGVTITRASGAPGDQRFNLQVRGYSSVNGNQPFILIDGAPGDINNINPADIAAITVLKDAAAAIYGNRAADGVILVTTKKGKSGAPGVQYTANVALKSPNYMKKMMNTLHYAEFLDEGLRNVGIPGIPDSIFEKIRNNAPPDLEQGWNYGLTNYPGFYGYTDWNKVIYKKAIQQYHNISISGGGEYTSYLFSGGYNRDNGTIRFGENYSDQYNLRFNYDFRLFKKVNFQTRTSFENTSTHQPSLLNGDNAITNTIRQLPFLPVYNLEGQFYGYQGYGNPAQWLTDGGQQLYQLSRFNTNIKADYKVVNGLTLTGQAAFRLDYDNNRSIVKTFTRYNYIGEVQDIRNNPNSAAYSNNKLLYKLFQVYADYNTRFGSDHRLNVTLGTSLEQTNHEGQNVTGYNFPGNNIFTLNLADRTKVAYSNFGGFLNNQALNSYFGRLSYSYKDKLILDVTGRTDGSSKFAPDKRWSDIFPSVALAYNLVGEEFIKRTNIFDLFKLRVSYGKLGNQDISALGLFDYTPLINVIKDGNGNVIAYPIGSPNAGLSGVAANPASNDRTWETIETKNIGIDLQTLNSRLSFSFDYFNKTNENMLVAIAVPATFGGNAPSSNQGRLETKGFETSISWNDQIKDFRYGVSAQLSDNRNKLVKLKNSDSYGQGLNFAREGYPIYSYFGYEFDGIIQTKEQLDEYKKLQGVPPDISLGDVMFKDLDGDGKLTQFGDQSKGLAGDMKYLGSLNPRYTYSSNLSVGYKQFDLSVFIQGIGKRTIQYQGAISTPNNFFWPTLEYYYGKTWSPDNTTAKYPRYIAGAVGFDDIRNYNYQTSSLVMQNAAYLRVKVITLSYNLPSSIAGKIKMRSARIYFSGQDLFTMSKGTLGGNFDPEDGFRDETTYPLNKVYSFGIDLNF